MEDFVPLANPAGDQAPLQSEILAAIASVIDRGAFILGEAVASFEQAMATRVGVPGAIGVGSGTDALVLALQAVGVGPGDEVITVSHTAGPTVAAIRMLGGIPVFVDIDPDNLCIDPHALPEAIGSKTKAIIAVHLYGHPAALDEIRTIADRNGIAVVEDCAQAQDATFRGEMVGSIGDAACFSFYPTKNLGAIGDGGLVVSRHAAIVDRLRRLRTYGWSKPQFAEIPDGRCSRLDELQAAILTVKLTRLTDSVQRRRELAKTYDEAFADLPVTCPVERVDCRHVYHLYVIRTERRDALAAHLKAAGIMTGLHYPYPVHQQPGLAAHARMGGPLTWTERVQNEILSLPLFPSMSQTQQMRVIEALRGFFR